jgi:hypothetical protein
MAAAETSCSALPAGMGLPPDSPCLRAGRFPCHPTQVARRSPHQKAALLTAIAPVSQILTLAACGTAGIPSAGRNDVTPHGVAAALRCLGGQVCAGPSITSTLP